MKNFAFKSAVNRIVMVVNAGILFGISRFDIEDKLIQMAGNDLRQRIEDDTYYPGSYPIRKSIFLSAMAWICKERGWYTKLAAVIGIFLASSLNTPFSSVLQAQNELKGGDFWEPECEDNYVMGESIELPMAFIVHDVELGSNTMIIFNTAGGTGFITFLPADIYQGGLQGTIAFEDGGQKIDQGSNGRIFTYYFRTAIGDLEVIYSCKIGWVLIHFNNSPYVITRVVEYEHTRD